MNKIAILPAVGLLLSLANVPAAEPRPDVWRIDSTGAAVCESGERRPWQRLDMHGQCVLMQIELPGTPNEDWKMALGWPILKVQHQVRGGIVPVSRKDWPQIKVNGVALSPGPRQSYRYDGIMTVQYPVTKGLRLSCALFPSVTRRAAIEEWTIENTQPQPVTIEMTSNRQTLAEPTNALKEPSLLERAVLGVEKRQLAPGQKATWAIVHTVRKKSDPPLDVDVAREKAARQALFRKARETMVLETPEPALNGTFALAKFRVLEAPVESSKGLLQGTGTAWYMGGIWANDNVEYASPVCPYLGDATLNEACNNMYRVWLNEKKPGISASYETYVLGNVGGGRGDQAMMMYGLSNYLLALGDAKMAEEFWPLLLKAVQLTKAATRADGVVTSHTDELEGRHPTGTANLSTASLAYGGYRAASRLARALGRASEAADYQASADAQANTIESYFGAEVEGYSTYRYFDGCTVLRGWISLPLAMGIMKRKAGTIDALFSPKLWGELDCPISAGTKVVSTAAGESWPRETYYTLRAAFKAGYTSLALQKTILAARRAMLSYRGPYMDEDNGDLLSPNVLYVSVITDGLFGIEPQSFTSFSCTPRLPTAWPSMKLSNIWLMGKPIDIEVKREAQSIRCIVLSGSVRLLDSVAADGATFTVDMKAITSVRSNQ